MFKKNISDHFHQYFSVFRADTEELKRHVYKLRYDVYFTELGYEKECPIDCEKDEFDEYSQHILIKHKESGLYAGCVRLITPPENNLGLLLPFEVNCLESIYEDKKSMLTLDNRIYIGELSRLAIHQTFRRRETDSISSPHGINIDRAPISFDADELRYFPLISIALYLSCMSIALNQEIKYVFVMMEPRLARHLSRSGIIFTQIGDIVGYHGPRAMFYIEKSTLIENFKLEFKAFYQSIDEQINAK